MHGHSFCQGAKRAFKLIVNNMMAIVAINSVGDFILLLAKMFVIAGTMTVGIKVLEVRIYMYKQI